MEILTVKSPCKITIISKGATLVTLVVAGHGGCYNIFGIWNNRLLSDPLWNIICGILGWVPTRSSSLWPAVFLDMALLFTLVTSHIWLDRLPYSRAIDISTMADLEVNLIQSIFDQLFNGHSVCLWKRSLVLRLLLVGSWFPPIWINKIAVLTIRLLYKGLIGDEILWWYDTHFTHTKFIDKPCNLIVLLNFPRKEYKVEIILKYASYVP